jgi:hypothetical protein
VQEYRNYTVKSQKHTLQKTTDGEWDLFTPLKDHAAEPAVKRVENVLSLLVAAHTLAREQREQMSLLERSGKDWHYDKLFRESLRTSDHTWRQLNAELMRYPWLAVSQGGPGKFWLSERSVTSSTGRWAPWERWAVGTLLNLAKKPGNLSRLRRCPVCLQWFYAIPSHRQFCGNSCYRRDKGQDPEFKEKRATYMRERREKEKEEEALSMRQIALVLSEKSKKGGK